jgi:hypothetical protein
MLIGRQRQRDAVAAVEGEDKEEEEAGIDGGKRW